MPMKPGMRMMMIDKMAERNRNRERPRSEYAADDGRRMIGYDRNYERERNGYDGDEDINNRGRRRNERYMERNDRYMMDDGENDNRYSTRRRNREEYAGYGEHLPPMDTYGTPPESRYYPHMPPIYPRGGEDMPRNTHGNSYGDIYAEGTIYAPGAMNRGSRNDAEEAQPMTEHKARDWVKRMHGSGGASGGKYEIADAEAMRNQYCPECDKWEFYAVINAMYSDYSDVARKFGVDRPEYYACLAKAFINDPDAVPGKTAKYMRYIAK